VTSKSQLHAGRNDTTSDLILSLSGKYQALLSIIKIEDLSEKVRIDERTMIH